MVVPITFRGSGEKNILSYTFTDIATGRGWVRFYGADVSGGVILTNSVIYGQAGMTPTNCDLDFDVTFDRNAIIDGNVIINASVVNYGQEEDDGVSHELIVYLRKYSGSTETTYASGAVIGTDNLLYQAHQDHVYAFKLAMPRTNFKVGDIFRISTTLTKKDTGISYLAHDPKNRTFSTWFPNTSNLLVDVPFVIDL